MVEAGLIHDEGLPWLNGMTIDGNFLMDICLYLELLGSLANQ